MEFDGWQGKMSEFYVGAKSRPIMCGYVNSAAVWNDYQLMWSARKVYPMKGHSDFLMCNDDDLGGNCTHTRLDRELEEFHFDRGEQRRGPQLGFRDHTQTRSDASLR